MKRDTHNIDAADISLGKLAAQTAVLLRGKNKPGFVKNTDEGDFVVVKNFSRVKVSGKKIEQKKYYRYSGHIGGLKEISMSKLIQEQPSEVLHRAVYRMLPKNKLRDQMIKRLTVKQ